MTTQAQRSDWLDFAKGAGICLVVVYHTTEGTLNSFPDAPASISLMAEYFRAWLMPMFFLVSGMLVQRSVLHDSDAKLRTKLFDWIYIYVVWSVIIYLTRLFSNSFTNTHMYTNEIFHILWDPVPTIWFIYALLLSFAVTIMVRRQPAVVVVSIALLVNILNAAFYGWFEDSIFQRLAWIYVFYAIGFFYAKPIQELLLSSHNSKLWILVFCLISPIVAFIKPYLPFFLLPFLSMITVMAFLQFCVSICRLTPNARLTHLLVYTGGISLFIYLTHFPFPAATRMALLKLGIYSHWLTMLIAVVVAVMVGYVASKLAVSTNVGVLFSRKLFSMKT